jgi:hypothetical protein
LSAGTLPVHDRRNNTRHLTAEQPNNTPDDAVRPFFGGGTTLIATETIGRVSLAAELEPCVPIVNRGPLGFIED